MNKQVQIMTAVKLVPPSNVDVKVDVKGLISLVWSNSVQQEEKDSIVSIIHFCGISSPVQEIELPADSSLLETLTSKYSQFVIIQ